MTKDEKIRGIIKAMTAYGGNCHDYDHYWTNENIELFKKWMDEQPKVNGLTLYRGYTFDERYFNDANITVGQLIGVDALTQDTMPAFTTDRIRATIYMNEFGEIGINGGVKVLFIIRTTGKAFVDISELSYYPDEREHRCTDNVRLAVTGIRQKAGYLQIELTETV